jgi:hypothetical protein
MVCAFYTVKISTMKCYGRWVRSRVLGQGSLKIPTTFKLDPLQSFVHNSFNWKASPWSKRRYTVCMLHRTAPFFNFVVMSWATHVLAGHIFHCFCRHEHWWTEKVWLSWALLFQKVCPFFSIDSLKMCRTWFINLTNLTKHREAMESFTARLHFQLDILYRRTGVLDDIW